MGLDRYQAFFGQHQIGNAKQRQQLSRVLCQTAITGFAVPEQVLHYVKRMLDLGFPMAMDTPGGYTDMGGVATVGVDIVPYYRRGATELMLPLLSGKQVADLSWIGPKQVDVKLNEPVARSFGLLVPPVQTKN